MRSKIKSRLIFLGSIVLFLVVFAFWYNATYKMDEVSGYVINSKEMPVKIAIASQGSPFKDAIVTNIINHYKKDSVFINVDDVSKLVTLSVAEYDVIIVLHTWEYGDPPKVVSEFIETHISEMEKIIVLGTSGAGTNKIKGIDAMAGESIIENASDLSDEIIEKIEKLLQ